MGLNLLRDAALRDPLGESMKTRPIVLAFWGCALITLLSPTIAGDFLPTEVACLIQARTDSAVYAGLTLPSRTLTAAERVFYQYAIEEVYWRHRIWPKENPGPKPPLDAVISRRQIEEKVEDYLRKSQLAANERGSAITAIELQ